MSQVRATYALYIDWSGDATATPDYARLRRGLTTLRSVGENVMPYTLMVECARGRARPVALPGEGDAEPGSLVATLYNPGGRFNLHNTASPLYGKIKPGRRVRLQATYGGVSYWLWSGYLVNVEPVVTGSDKPVARLTARGALARLSEPVVSPAADADGALFSDLIGAVLDAAGWPAALRAILASEGTAGPWWVRLQSALAALRDLESSELGFLWEPAGGGIGFQGRHYRAENSHTSQATFTDADAGPLSYERISQTDPLGGIVNVVEAQAFSYTTLESAVLWTHSPTAPLIIPPGGSVTLVARYPQSGVSDSVFVSGWETVTVGPTLASDIYFQGDVGSAGGDFVPTSETFTITQTPGANELTIAITNDDATKPGYIYRVQARGTAVERGDAVTVRAQDAASIAAYGRRPFRVPGSWLPSVQEAQAYADWVVARFKDPHARLSLTYTATKSAAYLVQALTRDLSERITVVANNATALGVNGGFFIESIRHLIDQGGTRHEVSYGLSPVPDPAPFRFDVSTFDGPDVLVY